MDDNFIDRIEKAAESLREFSSYKPETGIILLVPGGKTEELQNVISSNIDAYIPKNADAILRIHNNVKKLISEHNIIIFRKRRNFSLYVLLAFLILSALVLLFAYIRYPGYF